MSTQVLNDETAAQAPNKRKLELCISFAESGYCIYGSSCFFAHGLEELVMHQPTLRKKMCRNFHQHKYCKFGSRCNFVHDPKHGFYPKKPKSMLKMMEEYP
jgi:butyrate response factor 1